MKKVAVVILNWNGAKFLRKFLPSLLKHSSKAEIVVADNASADDSLVVLEKEFPQVHIIKNHRNEGFAKGYNTALKQIDADYYILLNSDVEVTANWIQPAVELLESDNTIGAVQPKIRSWYEPEKFEYAGAAGGFLDQYGYPFCRGRIFEHTEKDLQQYEDAREIFWATGACMFVRAELFHDAGGFDPDFFAHMEEIDFCWRIKHKGYKVMYTPKSLVYHVGGGTLPSSSSYKTYLNIRNNLAMLYKNLPQEKLNRTILFRLLLDGIAAVKFLFSGGFPEMASVLKAHFHFYRMLPDLKAKRKTLNPGKVSMIYRGNMVLEHYLYRKDTFNDLNQEKFQP